MAGLPLSRCPECGEAFTPQTLARMADARRAAWSAQADHLRAARVLWLAMLGSLLLVVVAAWAVGALAGAGMALTASLLGVTGLAATEGLRRAVRARMSDAESLGRGPSPRLTRGVLAATVFAFVVTIPAMAGAAIAVASLVFE
jgi:hypothetical protein